ncbi:MAG: hypothetical protein H6605_09995 [Flavobacteriales bacterium]|nr:hypothetical protein [Flavobacteriales bacterium]
MGVKQIFIRVLVMSFLFSGCYSFQGASIPPDVSTFSVGFFENKAATINPKLSQIVTEKLKDKMNNTRLDFTRQNGDFAFEGIINTYTVAPIAVQGDANASKNRLTIGIHVKFVCVKHPDKNFDSDFSSFSDFDATKNFSGLESTLVQEITDQLIQEVFNKAAVNW